eukprot:5890863-Prymnesium_polylepis.1
MHPDATETLSATVTTRGLRLDWCATMTQGEELGGPGVMMLMRQKVDLMPESRPGQALRTMLGTLAAGLDEFERKVADERSRLQQLKEERAELRRLEGSFAAPCDGVRNELGARFLRVLNRKKRRIRALEERLERWETGGDS